MLKLTKLFQFTYLSAIFWSVTSIHCHAQEHPLSGDDIYEIVVKDPAVYQISYEWLREQTGWTDVDIELVQLWHGTPLEQVPIEIIEDDISGWSQGDHIRFYGQGGQQYLPEYSMNPFDRNGHYFIKNGTQKGERIEVNVSPSFSISIATTDQYKVYEEDKYNLLEVSDLNSGSGQQWYGAEISGTSAYSLGPLLSQMAPWSKDITISTSMAVRSSVSETIELSGGHSPVSTRSRPVELGDPEDNYAHRVTLSTTISDITRSEIRIERRTPDTRVWLDQVRIDYKDNHVYDGNMRILRIPAEHQKVNYSIVNSTDQKAIAWLMHSSGAVSSQDLLAGNTEIPIDSVNSIILYSDSNLPAPTAALPVEARNISSIYGSDMIILYYGPFKAAADRLMSHRIAQGLTVSMIDIMDCYRYFGSGQHGPEGIRTMAKEAWEANPSFKYLLLLGDASYDYRGLTTSHDDQNLIPTYETKESLEPILAFPTDDYYALLDEEHPETLRGDLEIAVGRLTVRTPQEADNVVSKIIAYDTHQSDDPMWKRRLTFLADDEDYNLHLNDADRIATNVQERYPGYNQEKIYWDAYRQISTPGGNRYPDATDALNDAIDKGSLVINYLGHGGPRGWAQERVLKIDDIESWTNYQKLPLIITATCSFTGYDDPTITSAGEAALLNPVGGAVALYSTVRSVYASKNYRLTRAVFDRLFETDAQGQHLPIGEVLRLAKNSIASDNINARKFALIGDPSMQLHHTAQRVTVTHIDDRKLINTTDTDTITILTPTQMRGIVTQSDGMTDSSYQGSLHVTIYDKPSTVNTLSNDAQSPETSFEYRKNIIYQGVHPIINGHFDYEVSIPSDISYDMGSIRISHMATSETGVDISGYYDGLYIDGLDSSADLEPPHINAYINTPSHTDGQVVPSYSTLIAHLKDNVGINISRAAIGHEITATIIGEDRYTIVLNDHYTPDYGSSKSGKVTYTLPYLPNGEYTLELTAYDIANNSTTNKLTFRIEESGQRRISDVYLTPNPINVGQPTELSFRHDLAGKVMNLKTELYSLDGRYLGSMTQRVASQQQMVKMSDWLDFDIIPLELGSGMYLCRLIAESTSSGEVAASDLKKIIVLK